MGLCLVRVMPNLSTETPEKKRESVSRKGYKMLIGTTSFLAILGSIYDKANESTRQIILAQSMSTHLNLSLSSGNTHSNNQERAETPPRLEEVDLEELAISFLCPYSTHPDWKQIVSSFNEYGQTIAHISVTLGYSQLLQHLFTWKINLNIVDNMGSTALHYAYLFRQEECARFLIQSGADALILDDLGRSPSDLDASLEVKLHATVDIGSDNKTHSPSSAICTIKMPGEAEGRYAKHFFLRQWGRQIEDEKNDEIPLAKFQSGDTWGPYKAASTPPKFPLFPQR